MGVLLAHSAFSLALLLHFLLGLWLCIIEGTGILEHSPEIGEISEPPRGCGKKIRLSGIAEV